MTKTSSCPRVKILSPVKVEISTQRKHEHIETDHFLPRCQKRRLIGRHPEKTTNSKIHGEHDSNRICRESRRCCGSCFFDFMWGSNLFFFEIDAFKVSWSSWNLHLKPCFTVHLCFMLKSLIQQMQVNESHTLSNSTPSAFGGLLKQDIQPPQKNI